MRIAVLVKQIPAPEQLQFDGGRVVRDGVELQVNAYCRRANAKAVELAGTSGEVVVFTMGPPEAEDALREMIACGATRGIHLCDGAFAGSDTLATATVLAAAIRSEGPFDLVLAGLNSLDADTGQVPAQLAELLGIEIAPAARDLEVVEGTFKARLETDSGYRHVEGALPAVISTAERLCDPSKAPPELRQMVSADLISRLTASDLQLDLRSCGSAGSPTSVGEPRLIGANREPRRAETVAKAVDLLVGLGAFESAASERDSVAISTGTSDIEVWCVFEDYDAGEELLGEAAELASCVDGSVTAFVRSPIQTDLSVHGADSVMVVPGAAEPHEFAHALATSAAERKPWLLLVEGSQTGRVIASMVAARNRWGLTGDAIGLEVNTDSRIVAWKPAFSGRLEVPIYTTSEVQMATVRSGILARRSPRDRADLVVSVLDAAPASAIRTTSVDEGQGADADLRRAEIVVAVGQGVEPEGYTTVDELRAALGGAALGSTRKVTDKGWLPRNTQIGVTGHSLAPRLLVSIGASGRFNYTVGIRNSGVILAIDVNSDAEIFDQADIGIVGDWREVVAALTRELDARSLQLRS